MAQATNRISTLQILLIVLLFIGALIGAVFILAPPRDLPPPRSEVQYSERPEKKNPTDSSPRPDEATQPNQAEIEEEAPPPVALETPPEVSTPGDFILRVTVRDVDSGKGIAKAQVTVLSSETGNEALPTPMNEAIPAGLEIPLPAVEASAGSATSDLRGIAEVTLRQPGNYGVRVSAEGYVNPDAQNVTLSETAPSAALEFRLDDGASISGRVMEEGASTGIPEVRVYSQERGASATTDAEGRYVLSGFEPGEFSVAVDVEDAGYLPGKELPYERVEITRSGQDLKNVDFKLAPAGIVWGYVLDEARQPVSQTTVMLVSSESLANQLIKSVMQQSPPLSGSSDDTGYYELVGVPLQRDWQLYALGDAHAPQLAEKFFLTNAVRSARVDIFLFNGTNIYGRVVDSRKAPVPDAGVVCTPSFGEILGPFDSARAFRGTSSDEQGNFVIEELPAGQYQMLGIKEGFKYATSGTPIYPNGYSDITNVTIVLEAVDEGEHTIFGTVMNTSGETLAGADVALEGLTTTSLGGVERSETTDGRGDFVFDGIDVGMYQLRVTMEGYAPRVITNAMIDKQNDIHLSQSALVRGRVLVHETGRPPETPYTVTSRPYTEGGMLAMSLDQMAWDERSATFQNEDGSFELRVPAGESLLEGAAQGLAPGRTVVTAEPGQAVSGIVIELSETGGLIAGRVETGNGDSPQGATVILAEAGTEEEAIAFLGEQGGGRSQRVGADGEFRFEQLPPGEYIALARHAKYTPARVEGLMLGENERLTDVLLRLGSGGSLEGYVFNDGRPQEGALVGILATVGALKTATTDENGYYRIDDLPAGQHQAAARTGNVNNPMELLNAESVTVEIIDGQVTQHNFGETSGTRIEGFCVPGPPTFLGGRVVLREPGRSGIPLGGMAAVDQLQGMSTGINLDGSFAFDSGVPPDEYQIDVFYFINLNVTSSMQVRYVQTVLLTVTGEQEVMEVNLQVETF